MYALACNLIVIHCVVIVLINSFSVFTGHICDNSGSLYMYGVAPILVYKDKDKDKEALFNVAYNVTDNISS